MVVPLSKQPRGIDQGTQFQYFGRILCQRKEEEKKDLWIEKIYRYIKTGCQKGKSSVLVANLPRCNLTACIKNKNYLYLKLISWVVELGVASSNNQGVKFPSRPSWKKKIQIISQKWIDWIAQESNFHLDLVEKKSTLEQTDLNENGKKLSCEWFFIR